MRLTENNIRHIVEHTYNGMPYGYYVAMKSGRISDSREFINYDEKGRTTIKEFKKEWLPKSVQKFLDHHDPILTAADTEMEDFATYLYK